MIVKRFYGKNVGSWGNVDIDLAACAPVTVIQGRNFDEGDEAANGAGKSTLIDVLAIALYGKSLAGKTLKEMINWLSEDGVMEAGAYVDDLHIVRKTTKSKTTLKVFKISENGEESISAGQDALEQMLGLNWITFSFLYRFGGGETGIGSYARAGVEFRRRVQDALVQADRLTACLEASRKERSALRNERVAAETAIAHQKDELASETEALETISAKQSELESTIGLEAQEILKRLASMNNLEELLENALAYEALVESVEEKKLHYEQKTKQQTQLIEDAASESSRAAEYEKQINDLNEDRSEEKARIEKSLEDISEELSIVQADLRSCNTAHMTALNEQIASCDVRLLSLEEQKLASENAYNEALNLEDPSEDLRRVKTEFEELNAAWAECDEVRTALLKAIDKIGNEPDIHICAYKASIIGADADIKKLKAELGELTQLKPGSRCPTCKGEINESNLSGAQEVLEEKIAALQETKTAAENELAVQEKLAAKKHRYQTELKKVTQEAAEKKRACDAAQETVDAWKQEMRAYSLSRADLSMKKSNIDSLCINIAGTQKEKTRLLKELDALGPNKAQELEAQVRKLEKQRSMQRTALDEIQESCIAAMRKKERLTALALECRNRENTLLTTVDDISQSVKDARKLLKKAILDLEAYSADISSQSSSDDIRSEISKRDRMRARHTEITGILDECSQRANAVFSRVELRKKKVAECENRLLAAEDNLRYVDFWEAAFNSEGIRMMTLRELVPVLTDQAVRYMNLLVGSQIGIEFTEVLEPNLKRTDLNLPISYAQCSGGQAQRVSIALALAFLETMRIAASCDLNMFCIDEAKDSLDGPGTEGFCEAIHEIAQEGRRVFVITHDAAMKDMLVGSGAAKLMVEYKNGVSRIGK